MCAFKEDIFNSNTSCFKKLLRFKFPLGLKLFGSKEQFEPFNRAHQLKIGQTFLIYEIKSKEKTHQGIIVCLDLSDHGLKCEIGIIAFNWKLFLS